MTSSSKPIEALARGLKVLETLSSAETPMSNGQIARATGYAPSTVSRLTASLVKLGYLRALHNMYELTPKNLRLGYPVLAAETNTSRAQRILHELAYRTGCSTGYAIRDRLYVTFLVTSRASTPYSVNLAVGARLPLSVSAAGAAIIGATNEPERSRLLRSVRADLHERGLSVDDFEQRITEAMENWYVVTSGVWRDDIAGVAAPVRSGGRLDAVTVIMRTHQLNADKLSTITDEMRKAVQELTD